MEEEFPSCEQYYDIPEAVGLDGIDLEKYIIASYIIKRPRIWMDKAKNQTFSEFHINI